MDKVINKKFGIIMNYDTGKNKILENVYFLTNNMVELNAFIMSDIEEYQDDIKEEKEILSKAKTEQELVDYLMEYAGWEIVEDFKEEDFKHGYIAESDTYLLDFVEFKIAVRK